MKTLKYINVIILLTFFFIVWACKDNIFDNPVDTNVTLSSPSSLSVVFLADTAATISWEYKNPEKYLFLVELSEDNKTFSKLSEAANSNSLTANKAFLVGKKYYFRVNANGDMNKSGYASTEAVLAGLDAPTQLTATFQNDTTAVLTWIDNSLIETGFVIELSAKDNSHFEIIDTINANTTTTNVFDNFQKSMTYYFRLHAFTKHNTSTYSNIASNGIKPEVPILDLPSNGAIDQPLTPTLSWTASGGATSYTLQVSTNISFTSFIYNQSNLTSTTQQITGLAPLTNYYWRVSANNNYGNSIYSSAWSFTTTGFAPLVPILNLPSNGATDQSITPTLSWNSSNTAVSYTLQVATDNAFSNFVFNGDVGNVTNKQIIGLNYLTTYFWRVSATNAYGTSAYSSSRYFSTTGTALQPPTLLSPIDGTINQSLAPTLSWNASSRATSYTLQVSTNSSFTSYVYNQSNLTSSTQQVTGLSHSTTYYWRVSATNGYGTSEPSSSWSFTTGLPPAAPTLLSPTDGATDQSLTPTLSWNSSNGATSYTLQVSTNSSFTSYVYNQGNLTNTSQQVTGLTQTTTYFWRVSAVNSYGTSAPSANWWFMTGTPPIAPTLLSPANGTIELSFSPTLSWNTSPSATSYTLQLSTNSSFTSYVYNQTNLINNSQQISGLLPFTEYFWKVSAANSFGTSAFSTVWSFTATGIAPLAPTLLLPSDGATNQSLTPTLNWNASIDATSYTLQVSTSSSFTSYVFNQNYLPSTAQQLSGLTPFTNYYWHVSATNSYGTSTYSNIWSFTTGSPPQAPTLLAPSDGATNQSLTPTLSWNASSGATSYTLQVSTNSSFTSYVYNQSGLTSISQQVTELNHSTTYYWRVSATNSYGTSGPSSTWSFITGTPPAVPTLLAPSNGAIEQSLSPTLSWNASIGATSYRLQVSTNSSFTIYIYDQSSLINTTQQVTGLANSTTYYWRVSSANSYGTSSPTVSWSFSTGSPPQAPTLLSPTDGVTGQSITPTLSWNASIGATSYTLQISTSSSFTSYVFNQSDITSTTQLISGLSPFTNYYWRVSSTNVYGTSAYSAIWSFKTKPGSCPSTATVTYGGKTYNTVQIGTQCWLKENLDVGIMIQDNENQTNNGIIEKYCYNSSLNNCDTYGGLYKWNEAMDYYTISGTKGICPTGWHIPTDDEFLKLVLEVNNDGNSLKAIGQGTGAGAGTSTSGFSALLAGRFEDGNFFYLGVIAGFWGSKEYDATDAVNFRLFNDNSGNGLGGNYKSLGFSVRCIKDY